MSADALRSLREEVAAACRILARRGLVEGVLGHVSARAPGGMALRSRGPEEAGVLYTEPEDIVLHSLDGEALEDTEHRRPGEHPIHGEVYRARPDVGAVVHAHPPAVLACDLAGVPLRPIFGAYNIPAMRLALAGVPVFERSWLIHSAALAAPMVAALGDGPAVVLRGHGVVVVGETVEAATMRALDLEDWRASASRSPRPAAARPTSLRHDVAELPTGAALTTSLAWAHHGAPTRRRHADQEASGHDHHDDPTTMPRPLLDRGLGHAQSAASWSPASAASPTRTLARDGRRLAPSRSPAPMPTAPWPPPGALPVACDPAWPSARPGWGRRSPSCAPTPTSSGSSTPSTRAIPRRP
jgi:3,4-dihydroxyphthalate decarboxylase